MVKERSEQLEQQLEQKIALSRGLGLLTKHGRSQKKASFDMLDSFLGLGLKDG